jgi:hypothetical protein
MEGSMETLYEYLLENYKPNEPIFLAELQIEGMSRANLRQQIKKLTDAGKVSGLIMEFTSCRKKRFSNQGHSFHQKKCWNVNI